MNSENRKPVAILFVEMSEWFATVGGKIKEGKSIFDNEDDQGKEKVRWTFTRGNLTAKLGWEVSSVSQLKQTTKLCHTFNTSK